MPDCCDADGHLDNDKLEEKVESITVLTEIQTMRDKTGAEAYKIIRKQYNSVGAPHPETRAVVQTGILSLYCYCLDKGSDNQGFSSRVATLMFKCWWITLFLRWCQYHQAQIIVLDVIKVFDNHKWCSLWPV